MYGTFQIVIFAKEIEDRIDEEYVFNYY